MNAKFWNHVCIYAYVDVYLYLYLYEDSSTLQCLFKVSWSLLDGNGFTDSWDLALAALAP